MGRSYLAGARPHLHHGEARRRPRLGLDEGAARGAGGARIAADLERFFVPPYLGPRGWIGLRLEDADWDLVVAHVATSYRLIAPKRLAALVSTER